jgi:hypothetical protein
MKLPLHIPNPARFAGAYAANLRALSPASLRARAQLAFLMTQLGSMVAARSKTSTAKVNGFRATSAKSRLGVAPDMSYAERCLVDGGMQPAPKPVGRSEDWLKADKEHRDAVRANREPSLTNYEQGCYMRVKRQHPEAERADFVGIRSV